MASVHVLPKPVRNLPPILPCARCGDPGGAPNSPGSSRPARTDARAHGISNGLICKRCRDSLYRRSIRAAVAARSGKPPVRPPARALPGRPSTVVHVDDPLGPDWHDDIRCEFLMIARPAGVCLDLNEAAKLWRIDPEDVPIVLARLQVRHHSTHHTGACSPVRRVGDPERGGSSIGRGMYDRAARGKRRKGGVS